MLDTDGDGEGVPDCRDNCPDEPNLNQEDADGDGVGDVCDDCPNTIPGSAVDADGCPPKIPGDLDRDGDVDTGDFMRFQSCASGPATPQPDPTCANARLDEDDDVDQSDFGIFQRCHSGENRPADPHCVD